jgi:cytochrome c peroxidase
MKKIYPLIVFFCLSLLVSGVWVGVATADDDNDYKPRLTREERLGKLLFFDDNLSEPKGQSCAFCHDPAVGFTGPTSVVNATIAVYPGAVPTRFGNRKPPTAAYGGDSPVLHFDDEEGLWIGGMFWDGRATGWELGDPLAEQARGPFLNPLEQNNPSKEAVVKKVLTSKYRRLFKRVCGKTYDVDKYYDCIATSIAAYERSKEVNPFSSKYDYWLKGKANLTSQEMDGLSLFEGRAMCSACHISEPGPNGEPPLFTDFTYDNLGVPRNPLNPFYYEPEWNPLGTAWVDEGLGAFLRAQGINPYDEQIGKVKVPTLRNVDKRPHMLFVKDYGHNGYFKSLKEIVHFYNTRDVLPECSTVTAPTVPLPGENCWPEPEISVNVNTDELGDLGLSNAEEDALVAFMKTLNDGYEVDDDEDDDDDDDD